MPKKFIRRLTGAQRSREADTDLGMLLAFVAGAINAGGFLAAGFYTSHMTGMLSSIADHIVTHQAPLAAVAALYVLSFVCGAAASSVLVNWARARGLRSVFALALMLEAFLLLLFGVFASAAAGPAIALLCFIMGLQNALITKISKAEIRTTHVTGLATDLGIGAGRWLYNRLTGTAIDIQPEKMKLYAGLLFSFLAGGLIGAFLFQSVGFSATIPFAGLLALIASGPILDDLYSP